ncbi:SprT-like family protein [Halovenus aranensis]|uniref:SprT-like family protein n=1 Tax=Halovenus aranensis TaxID=890420 RepID=A0A1G8SNQ2_9EURY|nr:SprT-like domain-containing protein [Halovenus aranensis]SDJ30886.1 SprT-like family protein [Halovenus aranensis]
MATVSDKSLPDPAAYSVSRPCTHEEFLAAAKVYARAVVRATALSVTVSDLSWTVSTRAKRRAGAVRHRNGEPESVSLAWRQFEHGGWSATASTVRHELIHVHLLNENNDPGHGPAFRQLAETLETTVHCQRFTDPEWWVHCEDCETRLARYRRSKLVANPAAYQCGNCGGDLRVDPGDPS